jgi:hypothetical protein
MEDLEVTWCGLKTANPEGCVPRSRHTTPVEQAHD